MKHNYLRHRAAATTIAAMAALGVAAPMAQAGGAHKPALTRFGDSSKLGATTVKGTSVSIRPTAVNGLVINPYGRG